jgi:imidazolonepropionase-like amidohydrolase
MKKTLLALLIMVVACLGAAAQNPAKNYEYRNGQWFNGKEFVRATWYIQNGLLSSKTPARVDSVVDLDGRWVVPPMADAHCTSVAGNPTAETVLKSYMEDGVFYLQILGNTVAGRTEVEPKLNRPAAPDAVFSNGAITCTLGYPFLQIEGPANGARNPKVQAQRYDQLKNERKMLGDGYWFIDSKDALNRNWEQIKAQKPGLIAIYLLDSKNKGGQEGGGLLPDVAKAVVKKARKAGLRVVAHVETADDLRLGLKIGVDGFANLPGYNWDGAGDPGKYQLTDDDVKKLSKKKTAVTPLFFQSPSASARPAVEKFHGATLKRLLDQDVNLVIGSGDPQRTTRSELNYWFQLGGLDYARMLRVVCENTPRAVFPQRKIGRIADGYEASFVVLSDNPLQNLLKLRALSFRVKNGMLLHQQ